MRAIYCWMNPRRRVVNWRSFCVSTALCAISVLFPGADSAQTAAPGLTYVRLYADASGITHFADERLVLTPAGTGASVEERLFVNRLGDLKGVMFARLKASTNEDWHVAPRRQFRVCVRGIVEITTADGEKRRMMPGPWSPLQSLANAACRT